MQDYFKVNRRTYSIPMVLPDWRKHQRQEEAKSSSSTSASSSKKESNNNATTTSSDIMTDWFRCVRHTKKPTPIVIDQETKRYVQKRKKMQSKERIEEGSIPDLLLFQVVYFTDPAPFLSKCFPNNNTFVILFCFVLCCATSLSQGSCQDATIPG